MQGMAQVRSGLLVAVVMTGVALAGCGGAPGSASAPAGVSPIGSVAPDLTASPAPSASVAVVSPAPSASEAAASTAPSPSGAADSPAASGAALQCPASDAGNLALSTALDRTIRLADGRSIELTTAGIQARNGSWGGDDAIPEFGALDLGMTPAKAAAGGSYEVSGSPGMALTGGTARAWRRDQFSGRAGPNVTITGSPRGLKLTSDGERLLLVMPTAAATWVVELGPRWQTTCLQGDGVAYLLITTR
jgi:hypothetical protein